MNGKKHWEKVYQTKPPQLVSWTQAVPQASLDLIEALKLPKTAAIIDIGGGDSNLAGFLLERGYHDITVLDISETALERGKIKLGIRSDLALDCLRYHHAQAGAPLSSVA